MSDNDDDYTAANEENRFGGRVRRYARVGASASKLAARLATGKCSAARLITPNTPPN